MNRLRSTGALAALLLATTLAACGSAEVSSPASPGAAQGVEVAIAPPSATVAAGGTVGFAATVTGTAATTVTWSVEPAGCGSVSTSGLFTAPAGAATCSVVVTSTADPTQAATAAVTVTAPPPPTPVTVSVSPTSAALSGCRSRTFTATVTGSSDTTVTWSVQEGSAGGTVTSGGAYTAPSSPGVYHVVATSRADPTKSASAAVTVADQILSVAVSPSTITVAPGGTAQFTASVTTTCGTFTALRTVLSNGTVVAN